MDKKMVDKLKYILNNDKLNYPLLRITVSDWNVWTLNVINQPIKIQ